MNKKDILCIIFVVLNLLKNNFQIIMTVMRRCIFLSRLVASQFQKQYPDIYRRRFPSPEAEGNNKPKIKPPLLSIRKTKAFSIRN